MSQNSPHAKLIQDTDEDAESCGTASDSDVDADGLNDSNDKKAKFWVSAFSKSHLFFIRNCTVAGSVSLWVTILAIPHFHEWSEKLFFGGFYCAADAVLWDLEGHWCGVLPKMYDAYWGNMIQLIVFSVYQNTGTTTSLVWQGIAGTFCACVNIWLLSILYPHGAKVDESGSLLSPNYQPWVAWLDVLGVLFIFLISKAQENSIKFGMSWHIYFMMQFMNPATGPSLGVMQVWMLPSWIPTFWDSEGSVVFFTTVLGGVVAILATLGWLGMLIGAVWWGFAVVAVCFFHWSAYMAFLVGLILGVTVAYLCAHFLFGQYVGMGQCNIVHTAESAHSLCEGFSTLFKDCVQYICGDTRTGERLRILEQAKELQGVVDGFAAQTDAAWWEVFDVGRYGAIRKMYSDYNILIRELIDVSYAAQTSIDQEDFKGRDGVHHKFFAPLKQYMEDLQDETYKLMQTCVSCMNDGTIEEKEHAELTSGMGQVRHLQVELLNIYKTNTGQDSISSNLGDEHVFIFSLSMWAKLTTDFADNLCDVLKEPTSKRRGSLATTLTPDVQKNIVGARGILNATVATWNCKDMFEYSHLMFAVRNYIGITFCFIAGMYMKGTVFPGYSSVMASTLALLINHFAASAMQKNLHRLLGVVLGKVIPILLMSLLSGPSCGTLANAFFHGLLIFAFMFVFNYIYYTSKEWSLEGCLIAGFGCYGLIGKCSESRESDVATYSALYMEVGMVTAAIFFQTMIDTIIPGAPPASDKALDRMQEVKTQIIAAYKGFFEDEGTATMDASYESLSAAITACADLAAECHPAKVVAPGPHTDFKIDFYVGVLDLLRALQSDLKVLLLAIRGITTDDTEESNAPVLHAFRVCDTKDVQEDFMNTLGKTMQCVLSVLGHFDETPLKSKSLEHIKAQSGLEELTGLETLKMELDGKIATLRRRQSVAGSAGVDMDIAHDMRVRLTVAIRALNLATRHLAGIGELALKQRNYG